jgi:hypothetical protein
MQTIEYRRLAVPPVVVVTNAAGEAHVWPLADYEADSTACLAASGISTSPHVPERVTAAALKIALTRAGHRVAVESAIAAIAGSDPYAEAVDLWRGATHFQRAYPLWDQMAPSLSLSIADVDAVFIAAGAIDAEFDGL